MTGTKGVFGHYCLMEEYKYESECNSIARQLQEYKIARLENMMDVVLS